MEAFSKLVLFFTIFLYYALAADTMVVNQTINDGQTIVSPQQTFELGFFSPRNASENRYLGIWFKQLATGTVAWVANRETPIKNKSGELTLHSDGSLVLRDSTTDKVVWSSSTNGKVRHPVARLLDTGNFVVIGDSNGPDRYIWQSFDHFGDTQLPGMKFGRNLENGIVTNFTSSKSVDDPSRGLFMVYMDFNGLPQVFENKGDVILSRLGSWNGLAFTGRPSVNPNNSIYKIEYVWNEREIYSTFELINPTVLIKLMVSAEGNIAQYSWINRTKGWSLLSSPQSDSCDRYALCGPYGSCGIDQLPPCGCFKGFTPTSPDKWNLADWNDGCQRVIPLDCSVGEGFQKYSFMKLPDTGKSWFDRNMSIEQCEKKCKRDCNCMAYATLDIKYGTGCLLWNNELMDMRTFPGEGQDIYIRMAASELDKDKKVHRSWKKMWIVVIPVIAGLAILLGLFLLIIRKRKAQGRYDTQEKVLDLPMLSLSTLLSATNNFSAKNKIGQGGFGPVYKGCLEDGREVAVKRLSESSTQGIEEFKNEVVFISKLQHRNLVKILGWCIEGVEKLLVYEYMPNKGLDLYIYQEDQSKKLDWSQRFYILNGISRGLLYLHQDSRLRIIHRDLKAANILLDRDMNPKISDFGLARRFKEDETETNTSQVVGTYGYMSPEYVRDGVISVKSDIFSFGVMVLEIVSGQKNRLFSHQDHSHNLLGHAWMLYKEGKTFELVNAYSVESSHKFEVLRSIHVGLLCVQHNSNDRPDMSEVVMMLTGKGRLPEPKRPGFYVEDSSTLLTTIETQCSNNDVTLTHLEAR